MKTLNLEVDISRIICKHMFLLLIHTVNKITWLFVFQMGRLCISFLPLKMSSGVCVQNMRLD